jgi:hypothetical protein
VAPSDCSVRNACLFDKNRSKKLTHRHVARGVAAIGVVGGYVLLSEQFVFISLIPLIISFVSVLVIVQANEVLLLAWEAYRIESHVEVEGF